MQHNIPKDHYKLSSLLRLWYETNYPDNPEYAADSSTFYNFLWGFLKMRYESQGEVLRHHAERQTFRWMTDEWRDFENCTIEQFRKEVDRLASDANYIKLTPEEVKECLAMTPSGGPKLNLDLDFLNFCDIYIKGTYDRRYPKPPKIGVKSTMAFLRGKNPPTNDVEEEAIPGFRNVVILTETKSIDELLKVEKEEDESPWVRAVRNYYSKTGKRVAKLRKALGSHPKVLEKGNCELEQVVGLDKRDIQYHIPYVSINLSPFRKAIVGLSGGSKLTFGLIVSMMKSTLLYGAISTGFAFAASMFRFGVSYAGAQRLEQDYLYKLRSQVITVRGRSVIGNLVDEAVREKQKEAILAYHVLFSHAIEADNVQGHYMPKHEIKKVAEETVLSLKTSKVYGFDYHVDDGLNILLELEIAREHPSKPGYYRCVAPKLALSRMKKHMMHEAQIPIGGEQHYELMRSYLVKRYGERIKKIKMDKTPDSEI